MSALLPKTTFRHYSPLLKERMVMKPGKVLCCIFLLAILGLDTADVQMCRVQALPIWILTCLFVCLFLWCFSGLLYHIPLLTMFPRIGGENSSILFVTQLSQPCFFNTWNVENLCHTYVTYSFNFFQGKASTWPLWSILIPIYLHWHRTRKHIFTALWRADILHWSYPRSYAETSSFWSQS